MTAYTYTPAAYWHRQWDEITEPRQTVTVETLPEPQHLKPRKYQIQLHKKQQPAPRLDWRGAAFPEAGR